MKNTVFALLALALFWAISGLSTLHAATAPLAVTQPATRLSNSVARLNGTVNPGGLATLAWFEWGTASFNYQPTAPVALGSGLVTLAVSNNLSGLTPGILYRGRVVASNSQGVVRGMEVPFGSPALQLNGGAVLTNECHSAFADPATASGTLLAIGVGDSHSLGVKSDGTVAGWGSNSRGQTTIPAGLSNVVAVAGGEFHSVALKRDGTVAVWGDGSIFQLNIPAGLSNVVAVAAGRVHTLALRSDGTVVAWGYAFYGATTIPGGLSNVVAVAAGQYHSLALKSDGTVVAWGRNDFGQTTIPAGLSNVVAIGSGYNHSLAVKSDGTVIGWGWNVVGQLNVPGGLTNAVAAAGGQGHSVALKRDGTVVGWGSASYGVLNIPGGLSNVVALAVGFRSNLALKSDGTVVGWGDNTSGQLTIPAGLNTLTPAVDQDVSTNAPGSYLLTYTATNSLGGIAAPVTRTVVVRDTLPPVITVLGNNPLFNLSNVAFVDPGATALDACGGSFAVSTNSNVNVTAIGSYTVTYTSTDSYGNTTNRARTVVVIGPPGVMTQPVTGITANAATLNGTVNPGGSAAGYYFEYGLTTNYGSFTPASNLAAGITTLAVNTSIGGLVPLTLYHLRLVATNSLGTSMSADLAFTTADAPLVTTLAASGVTATNANLNGTVNPNGAAAKAYFQYGLTTNYGSYSATNSLAATNTTLSVSNLIGSLAPGTTYHFRLVGLNAAGTNVGVDAAFTTGAATPTVTTLVASGVTGANATLNGTVNPNGATTTAYFQYGPTTGYGSYSATNSLAATNTTLAVSNLISSLSPGTTYHFRLVASNSAGSAFGADQVIGVVPRAFTGAGPGQGLDLQGNFLYAVNVGSNGAPGLIGTANFTADNVSGVTITAPGGTLNTINTWANPNYGATTDGIRLKQAMSSIRFTVAPGILTVNLDGLQVGRSYQLQLMFIENGSDRVFNVNLNGTTVVPNFRLLDYGPSGTSIVIPYGFTATSINALIQMSGGLGGTDHNPTLSAFTLEVLAPAVTTLAASSFTATNATLNGTVNPNGDAATAYFQYGLTTNYGSFSATITLAATNVDLAVFSPISGLAPGTTYHYQLVGSNSAGTSTGSDLVFTTLSLQPVSFTLNGPIPLPGGAFRLSFTNRSGLGFTVLGTTNVALPLSNWTVLGAPAEAPSGQYQFTNTQATNKPIRFYRVRSP